MDEGNHDREEGSSRAPKRKRTSMKKKREIIEDNKTVTTNQRRMMEQPRLDEYGQKVVCEDPSDSYYEVRKIGPKERRILLFRWVYDHSGSIIPYEKLALAFAVCPRTIRSDVKLLREKGYIKTSEAKDEAGGTKGTAVTYVKGIPHDFLEFLPSMRKVTNSANTLGLRDWLWADYKTVVGMTDPFHTAGMKEENYKELTQRKEAIAKARGSLTAKLLCKMDQSPEFKPGPSITMKPAKWSPSDVKELQREIEAFLTEEPPFEDGIVAYLGSGSEAD